MHTPSSSVSPDSDEITKHMTPEAKAAYLEALGRHTDRRYTNGEEFVRYFERSGEDLMGHFFHPDHLLGTDVNVSELQADFLRDREGLNLGERFHLSLTPKYLGTILVAKLASTDHSVADESKRLYDEFQDLMKWFEINGVLEGAASTRDRFVQFDYIPTDDQSHKTSERKYMFHLLTSEAESSLVAYTDDYNNKTWVDFIIFKEVIADVPAYIFEQLLNKHNGIIDINDQGFQKQVQNLLYDDSQLSREVTRYKTRYYSATSPRL